MSEDPGHREILGDADQARRKFGQLCERGFAFAFFGAELHAGDQAAEILVALAGFGEQGVLLAIGTGDLGADVRAQACFFRGHMEARRAVEAIAVEQCDGRHVERGGGGDQLFRHGCATQKAESGTGVQLDVPQSKLPSTNQRPVECAQ